MKTIATVIETNGTIAIIETERTSACEGCHKKQEGETCSVCSLMGTGRKMQSKAENPIHAKVGDRVFVETATKRVLLYATLVFVLPIVLAVGGWFLVSIFREEYLWRGIGAAVGFAATFVGLRIYSGVIGKRQTDAVITEIVKQSIEKTDSKGN